jgi:hypothetical protein
VDGLDQYMFSSTLDGVSNFFGLFNELLQILLKDFSYRFDRTIYNIFGILASFRKNMAKTCPLKYLFQTQLINLHLQFVELLIFFNSSFA